MSQLPELLKVLSLSRTGEIISMFMDSEEKRIGLGGLSGKFGMNKPAVSKQMALMESSGLVTSGIIKDSSSPHLYYQTQQVNHIIISYG